jgi:hypothetical protein
MSIMSSRLSEQIRKRKMNKESIIKEIDEEMFSPCCINSLAKICGINKYQCVKCRRSWRIEEI